MAYCPSCKGEIDPLATRCPHCDYDFPLRSPPTVRHRLAHSRIADLALAAAQAFAILGCVAYLVEMILDIVNRDLTRDLYASPINFFILLGLLVVFARASERG